MDEILAFLKEFNFQTIISLGIIIWYFNRDLKMSIDNLDKDIRQMNTRVSRVEGILFGKDIYKHIDEPKA